MHAYKNRFKKHNQECNSYYLFELRVYTAFCEKKNKNKMKANNKTKKKNF